MTDEEFNELSKEDQTLYSAIKDNSTNVALITLPNNQNQSNHLDGKTVVDVIVEAHLGTVVTPDNKVVGINVFSLEQANTLEKNSQYTAGSSAIHEINEGYFAAKDGKGYIAAHNKALFGKSDDLSNLYTFNTKTSEVTRSIYVKSLNKKVDLWKD